MLKISLLGQFSINDGGILLKSVNTPRLQSLLAYLLLNQDTLQDRSQLAFLFWPDTTETQSHTNLRNLLYQLRHTLPDADSYIVVNKGTLQWRRDSDFLLDVDEFREAVSEAEAGIKKVDSAIIQQGLEKAIKLYRGDLLPGCYDDWIIPFREELSLEYTNALEWLIHLLEEKSDYAAAIVYAQRLLHCDPLHEGTYRCLIRLHALNDDRASALRVYHVCETVLQRELQVKPSLTTREAYLNLLGDKARSFSSPASKFAVPIIDRESEWAQILRAWHAVTTNHESQIVLLSGEAGIGKTRLVEEMSLWAGRQGITNATAYCYAAEGELAYSPILTWLRLQPLVTLEDIWLVEIARLLPEILMNRPDLPKPRPLTEEWQRERLFEALSHAILRLGDPLILILEDLQWCDRDSLEFLHFLLRFNQEARLLFIGAYRPEEIEPSRPLDTLLRTLRTERQVIEIDIEPLDENSTHKLASNIIGEEIDSETAQFLYQQTEGNPLFVVETLRAGLPVQTQLSAPDQASVFINNLMMKTDDLPNKVHSILTARFMQLSPNALALARLAATIGREFSFSLLIKASGRDADSLINELDELWRHRIVREQGIDAYDFTHNKLRDVVYKSMSPGRRQIFHLQDAQALEEIYAPNLVPVSQKIAAHYDLAGRPEKAVPYYLQAAEMARKIYANTDARELLKRGIAILESTQSHILDRDGLIRRFWEELGDLFILSAEYEEALHAYNQVQNLVSPDEMIDQARIYRKIAEIFREQRRYTDTLDACQIAETILGKHPNQEINRWWDEWIDVQIEKVWAYYWLAQWEALESLVERISLVVKARASSYNRMRFMLASCLMNLRKYRYVVSDGMLANSQDNLTISRSYGSLQNQIESLFELGFLYLWRHDLELAEENLLLSLDLSEKTGNLLFQTLNLTYLAVLYRFLGHEEHVLNYVRLLEQLTEITHMPDYAAVVKANLAWLALRKGDLVAAESESRNALEIWCKSPLVYPFQWQALWPLIGILLSRGEIVEAQKYVEALLEPTQQQLTKVLNDLLEKALKWGEKGKVDDSRACLEKAVVIASEMGYL